jgi:hypothetical protein
MEQWNDDVRRAYIEQVLVPALLPGDVVVMDNRPARPQSFAPRPKAIVATLLP